MTNCANRARSSAQKACERRADGDQKEALRNCSAQQAARQRACNLLGEAPYSPVINPANFVSVIDNPLFPLVPGTTFIYEGNTDAGLEHNEVTVTHNKKVILGVTCTEVRDTVQVGGKITEDTLDWYAQDKDGNVWYMGENSREIENGLTVSLSGSWTAGVDSAKPGIIMKAHPRLKDFYRQEFSPGTAEDLAQVIGVAAPVAVPFGSFTGCLKTRETTPLEPGARENKYYCSGIGNVLTEDLETKERLELIQVIAENPL